MSLVAGIRLFNCRYLLFYGFFDCRRVNQTFCLIVAWTGGATGGTPAIGGCATAIAFDVHLEDGCMMNETVDGGQRHSLVRKDLSPFAKWLIGGNQHRAS